MKQPRPLQLGREPGELYAAHWIVGRLDVAAAFGSPLRLRNRGLERNDSISLGVGIAFAGKAQDFADIIAVGGAERVIFGAFEQIIVAARHAETALRREHRIMCRRLGIGLDENGDRRIEFDGPEQIHETGPVVHGSDAREIGPSRLEAACLDRRLVHPARVEIADLLADPARLIGVLRHILDDVVNVLVDLVVEHRIDSGKRPIGFDRGPLEPAAVDEREEVVARLDP